MFKDTPLFTRDQR